jgi:Arc/MetJ-type ribon-helix-helix transcriptional regulator
MGDTGIIAAIAVSIIAGLFGIINLVIGILASRKKDKETLDTVRQGELNKQSDAIQDGLRAMLTEQATFFTSRLEMVEKDKNSISAERDTLRTENVNLRMENERLRNQKDSEQ